MRIAIDISQIVYGTGVSVYTKNLVENLIKIDTNNEYVLFATSLRRGGEIKSIFPQTKVFPIPPTLADLVWNKLHFFPIEKLIGKVDVFHSSDWTEPPSSAFKVTTVHDLYPLKFPKLTHPKILEVHKRKISWVLQESKRIIVPSESTKKDLLEIGAKEEIIRVIPEAPSLSKAGTAEVNAVMAKYNIRGEYLISVGISPLKNIKRMIEAFQLSRTGKDIKLVLIGRPLNIKISHERNVRILGHVDSPELAALITGSRGLIYASLYEGYGIPILDGFTCGVPVVTSNIASMPEVAGDAAELVDPESVNSIAEGIQNILRGPKAYIAKGERRVQEFSWEKTARMTMAVYNESHI